MQTFCLLVRHFDLRVLVDFVVLKCDRIRKNPVCEMEADSLWARSDFECDQDFELSDRVIGVAFDPLFPPQSVIHFDLDHSSG